MRQSEIWRTSTIYKNTVALKLREAGWPEEAAKLEQCHSYYTVAICNDCKLVRRFPNRCDQFYCPECANHLQNERKKQVEWWSNEVTQPKHVVLTVKNIPDLTPLHVDQFRDWFTKLRRRKFARNWLGGFYRLEVTNQKKGWHLHLHALVNARWIDKGELAKQWRDITNGLGYIVDVLDVREGSYLRKVTSYVAKGSDIAAWDPHQIVTFINAFLHKRTFGVFGSLYGKRSQFAEWLATLKTQRPKCECGSCNVSYLDEAKWLLLDCEPDAPLRERPPPDLQSEFLDLCQHQQFGPK